MLIDELDRRLLAALTRSGRATWADLAVELGLSAPAVAQRVHRLEQREVIVGFSAIVSPKLAPVCAFVHVRTSAAAAEPDPDATLASWPAVLEVHRVAGEDDVLLKVRCHSVAELDTLVRRVAALPRVATASARVVLNTAKETLNPPLPAEEETR